jgi:hypothetical protein
LKKWVIILGWRHFFVLLYFSDFSLHLLYKLWGAVWKLWVELPCSSITFSSCILRCKCMSSKEVGIAFLLLVNWPLPMIRALLCCICKILVWILHSVNNDFPSQAFFGLEIILMWCIHVFPSLTFNIFVVLLFKVVCCWQRVVTLCFFISNLMISAFNTECLSHLYLVWFLTWLGLYLLPPCYFYTADAACHFHFLLLSWSFSVSFSFYFLWFYHIPFARLLATDLIS